nr:hypothetical protein TetV2_00246 [Oceanusvirus sp.]
MPPKKKEPQHKHVTSFVREWTVEHGKGKKPTSHGYSAGFMECGDKKESFVEITKDEKVVSKKSFKGEKSIADMRKAVKMAKQKNKALASF